MGYAIAQAALKAGARVTLVSGPVNLNAPSGCHVEYVTSAEQMHTKVIENISKVNTFISCAAVADYRVAEIASQKIKKDNDHMHIALVKNQDIVADVARLENKPYVVGFAAETQKVEQ